MKSYKPHYTTCYLQQQTKQSMQANKRNTTQNTHSSHQRGEDALGSTTGHREAAMRAGVARSQRLAEVIRRLLAHDSHLRRQVRVVLLLLHRRAQPTHSIIKNSTKPIDIRAQHSDGELSNPPVPYWVERLQRHLRVHFVRLHIRLHVYLSSA